MENGKLIWVCCRYCHYRNICIGFGVDDCENVVLQLFCADGKKDSNSRLDSGGIISAINIKGVYFMIFELLNIMFTL